MLLQRRTGTPLFLWPNRSWREATAAIGADIVKHVLDAVGAERALISANPCVRRVRRQVLVAALAVWPQLEHCLGVP